MPVEKNSVIDNKYTIRQVDRSLTTKILGSDLDRFNKRPEALNDDLLNHWVDTSAYDKAHPNDEIVYSTALEEDEYTLSEFRAAEHSFSLIDFKDNMLPALKAVLEFAYYQEKDKEWETPLNPLNLILKTGEDDNGNRVINVRSFFRYPRLRKTIDSGYLDSVVKTAAYMLSPEEVDSVGKFDQLTAQDYADIFSAPDVLEQYDPDEVESYADFFFSVLSPSSQGFSSVKDLLENVGAEDAIQRVDNPRNKGAVGDLVGSGVNLADYQQSPNVEENTAKADSTPEKPLTKEEKERQELEKLEEERRKKKEAKEQAEANKAKKKPVANADEKQPKKKHHTFLILALLALIVGGGYFMYHKHQQQQLAQQRQQQQQQAAQSSSSDSPMNNSDFKNGMDVTSAGNYQQATDDFNKYFDNNNDGSNLSKQEIASVFNAYLHTNNYQKILDNIGSPATAWSLVEYLQSQNQMDKINGLHSNQPLIKFIQADNKHDQNGMVAAGEKGVNLHGNKQWEDDMCNAFAQTNKLKQGKEWAEEQKNSKQLIQSIKAHAYQAKKTSYDKINKALG